MAPNPQTQNLRSRKEAESKPAPKTEKLDDAAICKQALERHARWVERERENTDAAYDDLKFRPASNGTKPRLTPARTARR
jgi:hypothetical protein